MPSGVLVTVPGPARLTASANLTGAGGSTCSAAAPGTPRAAATITAPPGPVAVASPVGVTTATLWSDDSQMNTTPATVLLLASFATALNCAVASSAASDVVGGVTVTLATSCATATPAVPLTPSTLAVIVAFPFATAVTSPVALTVATPGA